MTNGVKPSLSDDASHIWVTDIRENDHVISQYMVKTKRLALTKNGKHFLSLTISDRTGDVETKVWDNAEKLGSLFREGDIIEVEGRASSYRNNIQLTLSNLMVPEEKADPSLFLEVASDNPSKMMTSLTKILKEVKNHHLKTLNDKFLSDGKFTKLFKKAPAAKNFHHGYISGLIEHTLSVCQLALKVAEQYPRLDKDLLITGSFLHDVGKIKEFEFDTRIDYTDEGRLLGHLVIGVNMIEEKISTIKGFPSGLQLKLNHMVLSHHGEYDFGSPKRPKFLEAVVLHQIDDLDAKMNGLGRFMEKDPKEGSWTDYNRMFERYFLKGSIQDDPEEEERQEEPHSIEDDRQTRLFS